MAASSFREQLFQVIDPRILGIYRIVFGIFALIEIVYFYQVHVIEDYLVQPRHLFNYDFLPLNPLSEGGLHLLLFALLLSSLSIITGVLYRWGMLFFCLGFSYFFLLEKAFYNNHLYLLCLLALLMSFIPADSAFSLTKKSKKTTRKWHLWILQFQVLLVYFFGGIAKLNYDWIVLQEPARTILSLNQIESEALVYILVYGGILLDILFPFAILYKPLKWPAIIIISFFHLSNHALFDDINIFPFFMLCSLVLFLSPKELRMPRRVIQEAQVPLGTGKTLAVLAVYAAFQVFMPLRHYLIPGNTDWTGEGQRFAWRMKIQNRQAEVCKFQILDYDTKTVYPVDMPLHIGIYQANQMILYPRMMLDFAHYLGEEARKKGKRNIAIRADIRLSFNGRAAQAVFSKDINLLELKWKHFGHNDWILPLEK